MDEWTKPVNVPGKQGELGGARVGVGDEEARQRGVGGCRSEGGGGGGVGDGGGVEDGGADEETAPAPAAEAEAVRYCCVHNENKKKGLLMRRVFVHGTWSKPLVG